MWRAAKNALPVKINLVKRYVLPEATCDHCQSQPEDVLHALWTCPCLTEVWESDNAWRFRRTESLADFQQLILHDSLASLAAKESDQSWRPNHSSRPDYYPSSTTIARLLSGAANEDNFSESQSPIYSNMDSSPRSFSEG